MFQTRSSSKQIIYQLSKSSYDRIIFSHTNKWKKNLFLTRSLSVNRFSVYMFNLHSSSHTCLYVAHLLLPTDHNFRSNTAMFIRGRTFPVFFRCPLLCTGASKTRPQILGMYITHTPHHPPAMIHIFSSSENLKLCRAVLKHFSSFKYIICQNIQFDITVPLTISLPESHQAILDRSWS